MYCVVKIKNCESILIVKYKWCEVFAYANLINSGSSHKLTKVFYSPHKVRLKPNFKLPISRGVFDFSVEAVYEATILDSFG